MNHISKINKNEGIPSSQCSVGIFNPNFYQMRYNMEDFIKKRNSAFNEEDPNGADDPELNMYTKTSTLFTKGSKIFYKNFFLNQAYSTNRGDLMAPMKAGAHPGLKKNMAALQAFKTLGTIRKSGIGLNN